MIAGQRPRSAAGPQRWPSGCAHDFAAAAHALGVSRYALPRDGTCMGNGLGAPSCPLVRGSRDSIVDLSRRRRLPRPPQAGGSRLGRAMCSPPFRRRRPTLRQQLLPRWAQLWNSSEWPAHLMEAPAAASVGTPAGWQGSPAALAGPAAQWARELPPERSQLLLCGSLPPVAPPTVAPLWLVTAPRTPRTPT
eukprot:TRINITY_DN18391_c0_g1_i1.p1 TRINITY_DN18391_c0_g1~~TRINITY_DN18391_c0_g1_i1.p1  ORF type:complete len:192 (+),score=19.11 TRINITY_DN18391_c0_g1_i1:76-651(+)